MRCQCEVKTLKSMFVCLIMYLGACVHTQPILKYYYGLTRKGLYVGDAFRRCGVVVVNSKHQDSAERNNLLFARRTQESSPC